MLSNFIDQKEKLIKSSKIKKVDIEDIVENPNNEFSINDLDELKESIKLYGLKNNITVYDEDDNGNYMIQSGHRRFECIKELYEEGLIGDEIPVYVIPQEQDIIQSKLDLVLANAQRNLSDQDKANLVGSLLNIWNEMSVELRPKGKKRDWIAGFLGCSGRTAQVYINSFEQDDDGVYEAVEEAVSPEDVMSNQVYDYEKLTKEINSIKNKIKKILTKCDENELSSIVISDGSGKTANVGSLLENQLARFELIVSMMKE